jgi:hypothetical protein
MRKKGTKFKIAILLLVASLVALGGVAFAAEKGHNEFYNNPYIAVLDGGKAYTIMPYKNIAKAYKDGNRDWLGMFTSSLKREEGNKFGDEINFGTLPDSSRVAGIGQHIYDEKRDGIIPLSKWVVRHTNSQCIHGDGVYGGDTNRWHGIGGSLGAVAANCFAWYYTGWQPVCADCGREFKMLHYTSNEAVASLKYIDTDLDYFWLCPYNIGLEQGKEYKHECNAISNNRYKVVYGDGVTDSSVIGYMVDSIHYYNDSTTYEGKAVVPQTKLNKNNYSRVGYVFDGWVDSKGNKYTDQQVVKNLTAENYTAVLGDTSGYFYLEATWRSVGSTLRINAGAGTYNGKLGYTDVAKKYMETVDVLNSSVGAPAGYLVSFVGNGGTPTQGSIRQNVTFARWLRVHNIGYLDYISGGVRYTYSGPDRSLEELRAEYNRHAITLPNVSGGGYFIGWYDGANNFIGGSGDTFTPSGDITLYAKYNSLKLDSTADYVAHNYVGAADLTWALDNPGNMTYQVYQSSQGSSGMDTVSQMYNRQLLSQGGGVLESGVTTLGSVDSTYTSSGYFTAPFSGNFTFVTVGAQGGNVGNFVGGYGGRVDIIKYMDKGEVLYLEVGMQGGAGNNYGSIVASGGVASKIKKTDGNAIVIAGGGGGATAVAGGGHSGYGVGSGSGGYGGGQGYPAGQGGSLVYHNHTNLGCVYHTHQGNSNDGGACYIVTGSGHRDCPPGGMLYWGHHGSGGICTQCGYDFGTNGNEPKGHGAYYCANGHENCNGTDYVIYGLGCGIPEGWTCGKNESFVESSTASYGGNSSYLGVGQERIVATGIANAYNHSGNGYIKVTGTDYGYNNNTYLYDVLSRDWAAPNKVVAQTPVVIDENNKKVSFSVPSDNGSTYWFGVVGTQKGGSATLESNVTKETLTTGTVGFYYTYGTSKKDIATVKAQGGALTSIGTGTTQLTLGVHATSTQWLSIAAYDRAGNVGATTHVEIQSKGGGGGIGDLWPVGANPIQMKSLESEGHVKWDAGRNGWWFRSDGKTEVRIGFDGYLKGTPRTNYQVDTNYYLVTMDGWSANIEYGLSHDRIASASGSWSGSGVRSVAANQYKVDTKTWLTESGYRYANATGSGKNSYSEAGFVANNSNGVIQVRPYASAELAGDSGKKSQTVKSSAAEANAGMIKLLCDNTAPTISNLDAFNTIKQNTDTEIRFSVTASDGQSGLREFQVVVTNEDNGTTRTYTDDNHDGIIEIVVSGNSTDLLFSGNVTVNSKAVDNVGNIRELDSEGYTFRMSTVLFDGMGEEVVTYGEGGGFVRGEAGKFAADVWGYPDKLEIQMQKDAKANEWISLDASFDAIVKDYQNRGFKENHYSEVIDLTVPLDLPQDGDYVVRVRSWKKVNGVDQMLESTEVIRVISTVSEGGSSGSVGRSILD